MAESKNQWFPAGDVPAAEPLPEGAVKPESALALVPGVARVAGSAYLNALEWSARASWRAGSRVARATSDAGEAAELMRDVVRTAEAVRTAATSVAQGAPLGPALVLMGEAMSAGPDLPVPSEELSPQTLRERGAALLARSREVSPPAQTHPAFGRIVEEVAPDEARILVLLLHGGPQPSVDVRTGGPVGRVTSQLLASGLSLIGMRAGVGRRESVPAYLNNLFRLGLIWFSKEPLRDAQEYQVVEAQPDVLAALHSVKFAKVVRRSIHLTPFGEEFCRACLVDELTAVEVFPEHEAPETE